MPMKNKFIFQFVFFFICIGKRDKLLLDSNGGGGLYPVTSSISYIPNPTILVYNNDENMDIDSLASIPQGNQSVTTVPFSSETEIEPMDSGLNLFRWFRANENVEITPIDQRYENQ